MRPRIYTASEPTPDSRRLRLVSFSVWAMVAGPIQRSSALLPARRIAVSLELRRGVATDAKECGRIVFEAFKGIATRHNFPQEFPSPDAGAMVMSFLLT